MIGVNFLRSLVPQRVHEWMFRFSSAKVNDDLRHKYAFSTSMWWSLENLKRCGLQPATILDIGAHVGSWTERTRLIWPEATFVMVEPQPNKHEKLRAMCNASTQLAPVLLGASDSGHVLFHMGERGGSSVFEQVDGTNWDATAEMETRTVDTLMKQRNLSGPFLAKLDVQGYELEVLRGAHETLKNTGAVLLEASLMPYNVAAPLFAEVVAFMTDRKFVAYDFCSFWRRQSDDAAFQVDVIFVPEASPLRAFKPFFL